MYHGNQQSSVPKYLVSKRVLLFWATETVYSILVMITTKISWFFLFLLYIPSQAQSQQCGALTSREVEGPFFVANADLDYAIAPANEIKDNRQGVSLRGQVSGKTML